MVCSFNLLVSFCTRIKSRYTQKSTASFWYLGKISFSVGLRTSLALSTSPTGENDHLERRAADPVLWIIKREVQSTRSEFLFWSRKNNISEDVKKLVIGWQASDSHIASCDCFTEGQEGLSHPYFSSPYAIFLLPRVACSLLWSKGHCHLKYTVDLKKNIAVPFILFVSWFA